MSADEHILAALSKTVAYAGEDPETALAWARKSAEAICLHVFAQEVGEPGRLMLDQLITKLDGKRLLPSTIAMHLHTVRAYGNFGAHARIERTSGDAPVDAELIRPCIAALSQVSRWYFADFLRRPLPDPVLELSGWAAQPRAPAPEGAPRRERPSAPPPDSDAPRLASDSPAVLAVTGQRSVFLHTSSGRWVEVDARGRPHAIASRDRSAPGRASGDDEAVPQASRPLAAATVDLDERLVVASFEAGLARLNRRSWETLEHSAPVTAIARCGSHTVAGDVTGLLFTVGREESVRCELGSPIVELRALGSTHVAALDADGDVHVVEWPPREPPVRVRSEHGPAVALFDAGREDAFVLATHARLEHRTLDARRPDAVSKELDAAVRTIAPFGHVVSRLCVVTDAGEVMLLDAELSTLRRALLRSSAEVVGACRAGDGSTLMWTATGELHCLTPARTLRCLAEDGVTFACADPSDADRVFVATWSADGHIGVETRSLA